MRITTFVVRALLPVCFGVLTAGCATLLLPAELRMSASELSYRLEQRFPVEKSVAGLVDVSLSKPKVSFAGERMATQFEVLVRVPLSGKTLNGTFGLSGRPHYDAASRGLFLRDARVDRLAIDNMPDALSGALAKLASQVAKGNFEDQPFHVFKPEDFSRFGIGYEPLGVAVRDQSLVLTLKR